MKHHNYAKEILSKLVLSEMDFRLDANVDVGMSDLEFN